jgi:hypothetical protein
MVLAMLLPLGGAAQQLGDMIHISYVTIEVDGNGVEKLHSEGDHYIAPTGAYRHDQVFANGRRASLFRFPDEGINVSVNHDYELAVASEYAAVPWNPNFDMRASPLQGVSPREDDTPSYDEGWEQESLGERAHGPILLRGYLDRQPGIGTIETWMYEHPGADLLVVLPVVVEMTVVLDDGQRLETRAAAIRRVAASADTFVVPYPLAK